MDLFGDVLNAVTGAANTAGTANPNPPATADLGHPGMVQALLGLLGNQGGAGGLSGLVQLFEQQGLGHLVGSWIGSGQNLPVSAQQVENVLGSDRLGQLAQQAGVPADQAGSLLASVLPGLVDRLTPTGTADHGLLEEGLIFLRGKMA
ncbi:MAG TPA: YidB family protein [Thermoanaerobaculia bacterium]|nr:YidB family protein [Thermoanaerobaculia bacterium]